MKTATLPPVRVEPHFRIELEGVLEHGETLSEFVENAVRATVEKRKNQAEFLRRGMHAIDQTQVADNGIPASAVIGRLEAKLVAARLARAKRNR